MTVSEKVVNNTLVATQDKLVSHSRPEEAVMLGDLIVKVHHQGPAQQSKVRGQDKSKGRFYSSCQGECPDHEDQIMIPKLYSVWNV